MIVYFIRTDSLQFEARGEKFCRYVKNQGFDVLMAAFVKKSFKVCYEAIQKVSNLGNKLVPRWVRHLAKFIALQYFFLKTFYERRKQISHIVIGNYEFIPVALILALIVKTPIYVDLHEHYFTKKFLPPYIAHFLLTRWLDGVILANQARADDLLDKYSRDEAVSIVRNFPDIVSSTLVLKNIQIGEKIKIAIVGNIAPGRFVEESIKYLDSNEFASKIELHLFGRFPLIKTSFIEHINHGPFNHGEIDDLMKSIDVSLVFYDRSHSKNYFLCEPNRFFQAYNAGNKIICFDHPSISEFYDDNVWVISEDNFKCELVQAVSNLTDNLNNVKINHECTRKVLTYKDGVAGLKWLK